MSLAVVESEIKEHIKAEARRALAEERAVLSNLVNHLKALESGEALTKAREYLAGVTAKVKSLEDGVEAEITKVKADIEESLREIEAHKLAVKGANQASAAAQSAPAPALAADPTPAPALNDAGVTSPDPAPVDAASSGSGLASS